MQGALQTFLFHLFAYSFLINTSGRVRSGNVFKYQLGSEITILGRGQEESKLAESPFFNRLII
ncbi:MAG: hypothetical protein C5B59_11775 [Bacteroidetes bacterium]|nr:MAG: hypothetical protein C5B59_11775 [Bacteroidota bacterium]